jgi:hypothetical protein
MSPAVRLRHRCFTSALGLRIFRALQFVAQSVRTSGLLPMAVCKGTGRSSVSAECVETIRQSFVRSPHTS